MQFVALRAMTLNSVSYVAGDIVPDTAFADSRLPFLIRRGLLAPDTTAMLVANDAADILGSGSATNGHVLTADGTGGVAWEAPA